MTSMSFLDPLYQLMQPGTPTKAASFVGDLTTNHGHPYYLTPGTSTEIILNHPSASANMTDSCARDTMTSCDTPGQSLSPTTPAASADLHNLLPPRTRSQTHAGIILCLPAQHTRAKTGNSQPIHKKPPPKNLASSSQLTNSRALKPEATSGGIEGEKTVKRRRVGSKRAIPCENSVGNSVLLQSNIPVVPKELTRDETRHMLMDKAKTEITRYLGD